MRIGAGILSLLAAALSTGCSSVVRYPFHTVASTNASRLPPGVRLGLYLDGVFERSLEGMPRRSYEMRIDIEQQPDVPEWRPSFEGASLRDDEGNVFALSAWYIEDGKSAPEGIKRYRAVFELNRPYRFQSIMAATVRWKLQSRGSPVFRITSQFQN